MYHNLTLFFMLVLIQISGCTPFRHEMGLAVVRQIGDVPCFSIENTEKTRTGKPNLVAIEVVGEHGDKVWAVEFKKLPTLTPDQCIPYGQTNAVYPPLVPAGPLIPGQVYGISIIAPMQDQYEAQSYSAEFCLLKHSGSGVRVHQIQMDIEASRWMREVCKVEITN